MFAAGTNLERLLTSLHRRGTVLHVVEAGGIGLLVGAGVALLATLLLWHAGQPVVTPALITLAGGGLAGLSWGIWRRPSALRAAIRADRQLHTDDLLATAVALDAARHHHDRNLWADAVLVMAERRSGDLSASSVILRRFGPRAWGGIGLSSAIAVIIAMLAGVPEPSQAEPLKDARQLQRNRDDHRPARPLVVLAPDSPLLQPSAIQRPDVGDNTAARQHEKTGPTSKPATQPSIAAADANQSSGAQSERGAGGGTSQVHRPPARTPTAIPTIAQNDAADRPVPTTTSGKPAGGAGGAATADPVTDNSGVRDPHGPAGSSHTAETALWQSQRWASDVQNARDQLRSGQLPPGHRDLIRAYFDVE